MSPWRVVRAKEVRETPDAPWWRWWVGRRGSGATPEPAAALLFVAVVAVLFFLGAVRLQARLGETGILAAEWLLLMVPVLLFVRLGGFDAVRTLSLRAPSTPAWGGALNGDQSVVSARPIRVSRCRAPPTWRWCWR